MDGKRYKSRYKVRRDDLNVTKKEAMELDFLCVPKDILQEVLREGKTYSVDEILKLVRAFGNKNSESI